MDVGLCWLHQYGPQFVAPISVEARLTQGTETEGGVPSPPYHDVFRFKTEWQRLGTCLYVRAHENDSETNTSPPCQWLNNHYNPVFVARGIKVSRSDSYSMHAGMYTARGEVPDSPAASLFEDV